MKLKGHSDNVKALVINSEGTQVKNTSIINFIDRKKHEAPKLSKQNQPNQNERKQQQQQQQQQQQYKRTIICELILPQIGQSAFP